MTPQGDEADWDAVEALTARRRAAAKRLASRQGAKRIVLWHRTTEGAQMRILRSGFRDGKGPYLTAEHHRGVWLSNVPLSVGEGTPDGPLLRVAVAISAAKLVREYEWIEEDKPYREFLLPAAVLNACARVELVSADKEPLAKHTRLLLERARGRPA
jgi:hypothetical protein